MREEKERGEWGVGRGVGMEVGSNLQRGQVGGGVGPDYKDNQRA